MKNHRYTEEELDFLRQHAEGRSRTELVGMLKERLVLMYQSDPVV